uniref:Uncharacterized protein n=1 Tax=Lepeophtheirus salmonis TaxID=72036 RepID=A0A0K2UKA8_LEPSM
MFFLRTSPKAKKYLKLDAVPTITSVFKTETDHTYGMKAHFASGEEIDFVASPGDMIQEVSKMAHLYLDMIGEVQVESLCHECHDYLHKIKELDITITLIKKTIKLMKKRGK